MCQGYEDFLRFFKLGPIETVFMLKGREMTVFDMEQLKIIAQVIILKMDKLRCPVKVQVRIGKCSFQKNTAPSSYCFSLSKDSNSSDISGWRTSINGIVNVNTFLVLETCCDPSDERVGLNIFSQNEGLSTMIGSASLSLKFDKLGKLRKYHIKNGKEIIATVDTSIYLFNLDHSLPIIESNSSISSNNQSLRNTSNIIHYDSIDPLAPNRPKKKSSNFSIQNEITWTIKQQNLTENNTDSLLIKLFQEIDKKKEEIDKRQAEINEKDAEIQHIRMKELTFQQQSKKIAKYRHNTALIIEANNDLIRKDDFYDEEFYKMKAEKEEMQEKVATISSQASLKLMCLQTELQSTNKKIENREKRVTQLINQIQQSTKELNSLKSQNKQKIKLIKTLYLQLKDGPNDHRYHAKSNTSEDILHLLAQYFETNHIKLVNQGENKELQLPEENAKREEVHMEDGQVIRKCKTLTLLKPTALSNQLSSRDKFRQNKDQNTGNALPVPTILEYILNLASSKRQP